MGGIVPSGPGPAAADRRGLSPRRWLSASLIALALAAFSSALDGPFLNYDDRQYVSENPVVKAGLTRGGVWLALTRSYAFNWHPLTWISLMLDVEIFGLDPRGFHLTNNLLHAANAALLFLLARALTGALWRSAALAALFAVHPLRVESVAWIVERKDVLAACLGFLALLAYVRHVRRPRRGSYLLTTLLFALGLMAKPLLVTWPLLMLVLDAWPLGRFRAAGAGEAPGWGRRRAAAARLLLEKAPWLALSAVASVLTFVAQSKGGAIMALDEPGAARLMNVLWAYGAYLGKTLWPANLAAYYPFENRSFLSLPVLGSVLLLAALTWAATANARRRPWIAAGWCWYLIALVPMIGVVRVGGQSMADRYSYVPLIGPVGALVWQIAAWARDTAPGRALATAALVVLAGAHFSLTRIQTTYWLNDTALFSRMEAAVPGNYAGAYGLGLVAHERGQFAEAERNYLRSIANGPRYYQARIKLALLYLGHGRLAEAEEAFRAALALTPDDAMAQSAFGLLLRQRGKPAEAAEHLGEVVRLAPVLPEAYNNLGVVLTELGRTGEAAASFRRALALKPGFAEARANLEAVLSTEGAGVPGEGVPRAP